MQGVEYWEHRCGSLEMNNEAILEKVIGSQRIFMDIRRMAFNPILGRETGGGEVRHYRCRLRKPGKEVNVYLSADAAEGLISLYDVLFLVAMDALSCEMLAGYGEFRNELQSIFAGSDGNLEEIEDFWREYRGRCEQAEKVRSFLGDALYRELLEYFKLEKPGTQTQETPVRFHDAVGR